MILNFLSFPHCGDTDCDPLTRAAGFVAETFIAGDAYARFSAKLSHCRKHPHPARMVVQTEARLLPT